MEARCTIEPVRVLGDPTQFQQVIGNLVSNAVKFTPPGGRVDVSLEAAPGVARIVVRDTGQGISADFLPHVFEPFRQGGLPADGAPRGLGLGLAIVRALVEQHRGMVRAESGGVGLGATFSVELPRMRETAGAAEVGCREKPALTAARRTRRRAAP